MITKKKKMTLDYVKLTVNDVTNLLGVSTTVGQTALQVTPFSAHSKATACEQKGIINVKKNMSP